MLLYAGGYFTSGKGRKAAWFDGSPSSHFAERDTEQNDTQIEHSIQMANEAQPGVPGRRRFGK